MKLKFILLLALGVSFVGCNKSEITPNRQATTQFSIQKNITQESIKVAERIDGILICTIDEDILRTAIANYYEADVTKRMVMIEKKKGKPNNYFLIKGRVKKGNTITRYAFELTPQELENGDIDLFLPVVGTEQRVVGPKGNTCKLRVTSVSTGFAVNNGSCVSSYGTSTSMDNTSTNGTNGLIQEINLIN